MRRSHRRYLMRIIALYRSHECLNWSDTIFGQRFYKGTGQLTRTKIFLWNQHEKGFLDIFGSKLAVRIWKLQHQCNASRLSLSLLSVILEKYIGSCNGQCMDALSVARTDMGDVILVRVTAFWVIFRVIIIREAVWVKNSLAATWSSIHIQLGLFDSVFQK